MVEVRPDAAEPRPCSHIAWPRILRLRYQLAAGLVVTAFLPTFIRGGLSLEGLSVGNNKETLIGLSLAYLLGFVATQKLGVFPGQNYFSTILPANLLGFGVVHSLFSLLRIDYSSSVFAFGFIVSLIWPLLVARLQESVVTQSLAVVGRSRTGKLPIVPQINWVAVASPNVLPTGIDGMVVDLRENFSPEWERFIGDVALAGIPVYHVKSVEEAIQGRVAIEHLSENTLGSLNPDDFYLKIKGMLDWILAAAAFVLLLPLFLAIYLAIRCDSDGPGLFTQERMGYRGAVFTMWKFRTMHIGQKSLAVDDAMTVDGDVRVTRVGRFLRRTRLDELPQIFNILRGEMSWIGPRPEAVVLSHWYQRELPYYRYRHIVKPGISGWAQVSQGHVTAVEDVLEKLYFDFYYIKNFSLWLDIVIATRTCLIMLGSKNTR